MTEKEILIEIFKEVRAIRGFLYWGPVVAVAAVVVLGMLIVLSAR